MDALIKSSINSTIKTISTQKQAEVDKAVASSFEKHVKPLHAEFETKRVEELKKAEATYIAEKNRINAFYDAEKKRVTDEDKLAVSSVVGAQYDRTVEKLSQVLTELEE